jgi:hypothetical protein
VGQGRCADAVRWLGRLSCSAACCIRQGVRPPNRAVRVLLVRHPAGGLQEQIGADYMDPATATLWWAGKEFFRDQTVGDR